MVFEKKISKWFIGLISVMKIYNFLLGVYSLITRLAPIFGPGTLNMNSACCSGLSFGGGVVRVATGIPTSMKNFSCPAGEQTQISRTGWEEIFLN